MTGQTDQFLLDELRQGNKAALHALYRDCQPRLLSYLARLSGRREVAQDISSEVWCRAAARLHTLRPDSRLLPWLFTIGRNLYFSHCRWRSRDEHCLNELRLAWDDPPPTPPEEALRSEREAALEAALAKLPRIYREAVVLAGVAGLAHEEAAEVAGIRIAAFRQRFSRGLRLLRECLTGGGTANGGGKNERSRQEQ